MTTRKFTLLVLFALTCNGAAQKSKPQPEPEPQDISQKIQGTITIRNNDGSVRPAPFVEVRIYEPQRDDLTNLVGAWESVIKKGRESSKGLSQFSFTCQEVILASLAGPRIGATYDRAEKSGNWDELKEQGLALYDSFHADKDGNFEYEAGIPGSSSVCMRPEGCERSYPEHRKYKKGEIMFFPPSNVFGNFLLVAFLNTPTTWYYWEEQIKIREGEKTPPVVLADPVVCNLAEGTK
jgi:hypothetical protein